MPKICLRYAYAPEICSRYARDMLDMHVMHALYLPYISMRYAWDKPEICLRYGWDTSKICLRFNWDLSESYVALININWGHLIEWSTWLWKHGTDRLSEWVTRPDLEMLTHLKIMENSMKVGGWGWQRTGLPLIFFLEKIHKLKTLEIALKSL